MDQLHTQLTSAESRATTAEAKVQRQQNQIKGMRWQLRCLHQTITKNKTKIRKLQAIANATAVVDLGGEVFNPGAADQSFAGGSSAQRMQKSRGVQQAVQAIMARCEGSKRNPQRRLLVVFSIMTLSVSATKMLRVTMR